MFYVLADVSIILLREIVTHKSQIDIITQTTSAQINVILSFY